jgi:hypothetical protein
VEIVGWNSFPEECAVEIDFDDAPLWMRLTAHTIFFERFVYPRAVKMGLGTLWIESGSIIESELLIRNGWKIRSNESKTDLEKFLEGSLSFLSANESKRIHKPLAVTKWGRKKAWQKYVHKHNGTFAFYQQKTLPEVH